MTVNPAARRPRNKSRFAVLGMLSMGLETGYQMKKHVEENLGHFWSESYGQIYPILDQLRAEGLVTCRSEARAGRPGRKLYRLTDKGRAALVSWLREPPEPQPPRLELLLKLSFAARAEAGVSRGHLSEYRDMCVRDLVMLRDIEKALEADPDLHPDLPFWLMTLRYGIAIRAAEREWCEQTLAHLRGVEDKAARAARRRAAR